MSPRATSDRPISTAVRRRLRILPAAGVGLTLTVCITAAALYSGGLSVPVALTGTLTGTLLAGGFFAFRALTPLLGRATTVAAFALGGASVLGTWAALSPTCPGATTGGRCTTAEIGTWALSGAIYPVAYLAVLGIPLLGAGAVRTVARKVRRLLGTVRAKVKSRTPGRP